MQVKSQVTRRGIATRGLLLQTLQTDRLQIARHIRVQLPRGNRVKLQHLPQRDRQGRRLKRRPPGQRRVQHRPQRIDVGRGSDFVRSGRLLGSHEARRAENLPGRGQPLVFVRPLGEAEVRDSGSSRSGRSLRSGISRGDLFEQNVGRFEISMDDSVPMSKRNRLGHVHHQPRRLPGLQWSVPQRGGQALAGDVGHRKIMLPVVLTNFVNRHDARMIQIRRRFGFGMKPPHFVLAGQLTGQDHLHGNRPIEPRLPCAINDTHAAPRDLFDQFVLAEVGDPSSRPERLGHCPIANRFVLPHHPAIAFGRIRHDIRQFVLNRLRRVQLDHRQCVLNRRVEESAGAKMRIEQLVNLAPRVGIVATNAIEKRRPLVRRRECECLSKDRFDVAHE